MIRPSQLIVYKLGNLRNSFSMPINLNEHFVVLKRMHAEKVDPPPPDDNKRNKAATKTGQKQKIMYITLIGTDGKLSTSTLEAANKLAKRRDLKLIKVSDFDIKKQNPLYKLLSSNQILEEDIHLKKASKENKGLKAPKIVSMSHKISEHDLKSKAKSIIKWLEKSHEVKVTITGTQDTHQAVSNNLDTISLLEHSLRDRKFYDTGWGRNNLGF